MNNFIVETLDIHHISQVIKDTSRYNNAVQKQVKFSRETDFFFRLERSKIYLNIKVKKKMRIHEI